MASDRPGQTDPRQVRTVKPGDRVLRVRTRRTKLPLIEREFGGRLSSVADFFRELATETPVVWMIAGLGLLVFTAPIPVWLFERSEDGSGVTSYWLGLWWAVSAFTTVGHSSVDVESAGARIIGSVYTILSVMLFFGSVIAAFSSYFILTWRRPKRQLVDTVNYYLQRIDELSTEEIEDLEDMTSGLLRTAKERADLEGRPSKQAEPEGPS